jgi:hypothetical protein
MFFSGDLLTLPPFWKPFGIGMLLSAILEDRIHDWLCNAKKSWPGLHLTNLQGVERDARPDATRSDILPRLVEDLISSYSTSFKTLATTSDYYESRYTTKSLNQTQSHTYASCLLRCKHRKGSIWTSPDTWYDVQPKFDITVL